MSDVVKCDFLPAGREANGKRELYKNISQIQAIQIAFTERHTHILGRSLIFV